ncbi:MAG TPA: glycogen/starch/alpha-glucan phosphorylase, partial [Vicinamibacterales bacterium]
MPDTLGTHDQHRRLPSRRNRPGDRPKSTKSESKAGPPSGIDLDDVRTGTSADAIAEALVDNLHYLQAKSPQHATLTDWYMALAYTARDRMLDRYIATVEAITSAPSTKVVAYLSAEFLTGPHLGNGLINLGLWDATRDAVSRMGLDLSTLLEQEEEPGLGNGGLGRLAACYMDSLATLNVPAIGYGIRYEFGIFDQAIRDGWQVERTDKWLRFGNPWEIVRPETAFQVKFGGRTEWHPDEQGHLRVRWLPDQMIKGVAYDTPVPGYRGPTTNLLRLWKAEATESFDFDAFNVGDYYRAVEEKVRSETISKVLYPNDEPAIGKRLRLAQQYFFVSCSLQDMIRLHVVQGRRLDEFDAHWAVQLNDTHPSIAVAELMRLLVDEHLLSWDQAWGITERACAYTNHTLLAEALEKWPLPIFGAMLPRHLEIIFEINRRFLDGVKRQCPGDDQLLARLSIIDETGDRYVRMAHLASVGSHAINGVAELHTRLLKQTVLSDICALTPNKFVNVTNGVTPRRWMVLSNPGLTALITRHIGDRWVSDLEDEISRIEPLATDDNFQRQWQDVKAENKRSLASLIRDRTGIVVNPDSMFDIQVKRLHEYKRQHLNALYLVTLYNRLLRASTTTVTPRTVIFGGKAAPSYRMAKLIIRLINGVADVVNQNPKVSQFLKVVFLPDFNVKNSHRVYPAAELSEQISTAGKEASGTGNMKFAMNGALTIGTLDGANIEIREAVGDENMFIFGLTAEQIEARRENASYRPRDLYRRDARLKRVLDAFDSDRFSPQEPGLFHWITESLLDCGDPYFHCADLPAYIDAQHEVERAFAQPATWASKAILNVARIGRFSSDRT